jgi:hypothetical protein
MADWTDLWLQRTAKFGPMVWRDGGRPATGGKKSQLHPLAH